MTPRKQTFSRQIVVFDRSWYRRVLVERVEGFASKHEWQRGYEEINEFERMMVSDGIRIAKIFLHITPPEQVRRFKDRLANPLKRWKLSYEDFRNRSRWADYEGAIEDMMEKTSHRVGSLVFDTGKRQAVKRPRYIYHAVSTERQNQSQYQ